MGPDRKEETCALDWVRGRREVGWSGWDARRLAVAACDRRRAQGERGSWEEGSVLGPGKLRTHSRSRARWVEKEPSYVPGGIQDQFTVRQRGHPVQRPGGDLPGASHPS